MALFADLTELQPSEVADNDFLLIYARSLQKARKVKAKAFRQGEVESVNGKKGAVQLKMPDVVNVGDNLSYNEQTNTLSADAQEITVDSELSGTSTNPVQNKAVKAALAGKADTTTVYKIDSDVKNLKSGKVDKVYGKGLSTNDYITEDKQKVDALGTASTKNVPSSGNASASEVVMGNDTRLSDSRNAKDVCSWAKASSKPAYTAAEVGAIATTEKGAANGVASLDGSGKVPSSQLPSYVDDVLEYASFLDFSATGESGKIYVAADTNKTYRWSGTAYAEISESLALGETSSTAFAGDRGKAIEDKIPANTSPSNPLITKEILNGYISNLSRSVSNKVDKIPGKGLSTNDYTTEEKNKLAGLEQVTVDSQLSETSTNPVQNKKITEVLNTKADAQEVRDMIETLIELQDYVKKTELDEILEGYVKKTDPTVRHVVSIEPYTEGWSKVGDDLLVCDNLSDTTEQATGASSITPPDLQVAYTYNDGSTEIVTVTSRRMELEDFCRIPNTKKYFPSSNYYNSNSYWIEPSKQKRHYISVMDKKNYYGFYLMRANKIDNSSSYYVRFVWKAPFELLNKTLEKTPITTIVTNIETFMINWAYALPVDNGKKMAILFCPAFYNREMAHFYYIYNRYDQSYYNNSVYSYINNFIATTNAQYQSEYDIFVDNISVYFNDGSVIETAGVLHNLTESEALMIGPEGFAKMFGTLTCRTNNRQILLALNEGETGYKWFDMATGHVTLTQDGNTTGEWATVKGFIIDL